MKLHCKKMKNFMTKLQEQQNKKSKHKSRAVIDSTDIDIIKQNKGSIHIFKYRYIDTNFKISIYRYTFQNIDISD